MTNHPDDERTPPADAFEAWVAEEARAHYHVAPTIPRDRLWESIRSARHDEPKGHATRVLPMRAPRPSWALRVMGLAAAVLVGVGIDRVIDRPAGIGSAPAVATVDDATSAEERVLRAAVDEHFSRSEAVLTAARLASREATPESDTEVVAWARDLLTTTRLLRDARADRDPRLRLLMDDLELALAQLVQFQRSGRARDAVALRETLADSDLLTRLRGVSATPVPSRDDTPRTE
jgi:hypothetical protein